jgi:hypothetical protein
MELSALWVVNLILGLQPVIKGAYFFYYLWGGTESLGILLVPGTAATLAYCTNPDDK